MAEKQLEGRKLCVHFPAKLVSIKISGGAFFTKDSPQDSETAIKIAQGIMKIMEMPEAEKTVFCFEVGGGNFGRGKNITEQRYERVEADRRGIKHSITNGMLLEEKLTTCLKTEIAENPIKRSILEKRLPRLMISQDDRETGEKFIIKKALRHIEKGRTPIFAGGIARPGFDTDTSLMSHSFEIGADQIIKGTRVDGVFQEDPEKNPHASKIAAIKYEDLIEDIIHGNKFEVIDRSAIIYALKNHYRPPIRIFKMFDENGNLYTEKLFKILRDDAEKGDKDIGSLIY